jgi:GTPase SAR1 family protein
MDYKVILNSIDSVINNSEFSIERRERLLNSLRKIRQRTTNPNIYIGIVGEFSSGKSTLINALMGADFFVTNAVQGITTVITKLEYSDTINIVLKYKSGKSISYKNNESEILQLYLQGEYKKLSFKSRLLMKSKGLLGLNRYDEYFLNFFDIITTSNDVSAELDEVTVYYPSTILKDGLVIVDTPGTDSLIPEHNLITQRAIRDICDLTLVVVPATTPLSMTLVDFLEANLIDNIDKCRFIITKIELLRKEIERTHLINGVTKRIEQFLGVDNPVVIPAPTLVSLEYYSVIDKVEFLDYLSGDAKEILTNHFFNNIANMKDEIYSNKDNTIHDKIKHLVYFLNDELSQELKAQAKQLEDDLQQTKLMRAKPLADFMSEFYATNDVYRISYIEAKISNTVTNKCDSLKRYVNNKINNADSKDDAQNSMSETSTREYGSGCFNDCYTTFSDLLDGTKESFESNFKKFRDLFTESYGIDAIDFSYKLENNPSWNRKYNFSYDKSNLTTFPVFRFFKSLEYVKQQMINDVNPKINSSFTKIESYYLKKVRNAYSELSKQMDKVKHLFVSKYQKVIIQRIADSDEREKTLQSRIDNLNHQQEIIKGIKM